MRTDETRRAEMHASRDHRPPRAVCPQIAALWHQGYSAQQIASIMGRSLADVRIVTAQLRPPDRAEFNSGNLRGAGR